MKDYTGLGVGPDPAGDTGDTMKDYTGLGAGPDPAGDTGTL